MSDKTAVQPALSAEEWEAIFKEGDRIKLAALALHGMAVGFSSFDLEVLRQLPTYVIGLGMGQDPEGLANYIRGLTVRIAALLLPESP